MIRAGSAGKGVDQETAAEATDETDDSSDRNGGGGLTERDTTDEYYSFHSCTMRSDVKPYVDDARKLLRHIYPHEGQ